MTTNDDLDVALIRRRDARLAGLAEQARAVSSPGRVESWRGDEDRR